MSNCSGAQDGGEGTALFWDHSSAGVSMLSEVALMSQSCEDVTSAGHHPGFCFGATELAGDCWICIIPNSRPVNSLSNPTLTGSISPTCFIEPVLMLFKVFANTLLRHCWYCLQLSASNYNETTHYSCHWNLYNLESKGICSFVLLGGNRSITEGLL